MFATATLVSRFKARGTAARTPDEELRVGTRQREAGRARVREWVETEPVSEAVTTRRENARVEREPITEANVEQATRGPDISEAEYEATLTQEEPVVEKRTVPK